MAIPFLKSIRARAGTRTDDALALFEAESEPTPGSAPLADAPDNSLPQIEADSPLGEFEVSEPITLEKVLEQRTFVSWQESVAIIEGTCAALVPADGKELPAPDPAEIVLTADGRIDVHSGGFGLGRGDSVQRLARALHALTSGQTIPAPLRLFISKWIAADGTRSVAQFSRELAYFARPDGAELIRHVYERYVSTPAAKTPVAPQKKAEVAEPPKAEKQQPPAAKRRRSALIAAAVAFLLAAALSIAFYQPAQGGEAGSSDLLATLMARASDFARSLGEVRTQIGNLSTQLTAHLAAGDAPAAAPPKPASAPAASNRPRPTGRASGAGAAPRVAAISVLPTISDAPAGVVVETPSDSPLELAGASEAAAPVVAIARDPDAVYSNEDAAVDPPKMVYPQLPPPALVLGASSVNVMEILIGQDGMVEKVKLVSPPRRMTDMMLLSGAKLWKFAPASLDGLPVKYRLAVSWSAPVP